MNLSTDTGTLLARTYSLTRGPRVRLRLARPHDAPAISALMARQGLRPEELQVARLVRFDPRTRAVICALALVDSNETVVGLGSIDLGAGRHREPDLMLVDAGLTDGLEELLGRALRGRADALARTRAA